MHQGKDEPARVLTQAQANLSGFRYSSWNQTELTDSQSRCKVESHLGSLPSLVHGVERDVPAFEKEQRPGRLEQG